MIVVAIIGILAAVAIPGFMAYIKNSKTTEAKTDINSIQKGAVSYFEAEHYSADGMTANSKQYPTSMQTAKKYGVEPTGNTIGVKQNPLSDDVKKQAIDIPWTDLKFKITSPFYYSYAYISDGMEFEKGKDWKETNPVYVIKDGSARKLSHFQVTACASLSDAKDSTFYLNGYSDGSTSPVIEGGKCYDAVVPSDPKI